MSYSERVRNPANRIKRVDLILSDIENYSLN
jgi:hypothetical protein